LLIQTVTPKLVAIDRAPGISNFVPTTNTKSGHNSRSSSTASKISVSYGSGSPYNNTSGLSLPILGFSFPFDIQV
jgi:hypothetical protein